MTVSPFNLFLLFLVGLVAGTVDAIAGGGGLITLPALLAVGLPPQLALGTNKLQSSFGSFVAARHYARHGLLDFRDAVPGILATCLGASGGAWSVQHVDGETLAAIIPALLIIIGGYSLLSPEFGKENSQARMPHLLFHALFGVLLGFYDGFFGPGTGTFWMAAFAGLLGMNFMRATAYTKVMNFTSNAVSLFVFLLSHSVVFQIGFCMAAGQIFGSSLGARLTVYKGVKLIRPLFIIVALIAAVKLLRSSL